MYYVPAQQLQQMHNGHPGIQNPEVAHIKHMSWPVSKPIQQNKQIHISLNRDHGHLAQPMSTRATVCEYPYQQRNPLVDFSPLHMRNLGSQTPLQTQHTIDDDILYSCKVIAQLQGNYEIETSNGIVQVSVILPEVGEHQEQYAKVQQVSMHGNALEEKFIYSELFYFKLCSANNKVEGILKRGSNIKHSVEWWNAEDQSSTVWLRKGNTTFNLVQVDTNSRRNSLSSVCTVSTIIPCPIDASTIDSEQNPLGIRSELLQPRRPIFLNHSSSGHFSPAVSLQSNCNNTFVRGSVSKSYESPDELLELIKTQCLKNKLLFKKVVAWVTANNPERQISQDDMKYLLEGRFWILAHSKDMGQKEASMDTLDDIKGAYQQTSTGVYVQPDPKECGSGVQHRLSKDQHGYWILERQDLGCDRWQLRARQEKNEQWIDFKHNRTQIRVHIIPMSSILEKMGEEHVENKNEMKKRLDFLFTSCNQEKLTRLKGRSLKHHIANLKVKLEKRRALSFGVRVANIAETISQE